MKSRIPHLFNDTTVAYPRDDCVHELFETQARIRANAIAVVSESEAFTYREIDERANQLAHHLRKLGVANGDVVGLLIERSVALVVATLGILKAGAAYMPLDTEYPAKRIDFMLKDTGAIAVISDHSRLRDHVAETTFGVDLSAHASEIDASPRTTPRCGVAAESPAYVMYTSGSTGRPNGVVVPHRAVVRLLFGTDFLPFGPDQCHLLNAPFSFDASIFELWGALLHGARLVVLRRPMPSQSLLTRYRVSCLWLTSALFNVLIDRQPAALLSIQHLLIGGEALSLKHVRRALEILPDTQISNGYGPTEATTFSCIFPIPRDLPADLDSVPIGRPISNTRVYVLDSSLQPVVGSEPGQLYIAGDGLAIGYVNRPTLTDERFLRDPFVAEEHARMYRTGDLGRCLPDGNLEFLGRVDQQIKIQGHRIEPAEIEVVLERHIHVRQAVVVAALEGRARCLFAYLTLEGNAEGAPDDLRQHLADRLPAYLTPARFIVLDEMPLTANGKIDRHDLKRRTGEKMGAVDSV